MVGESSFLKSGFSTCSYEILSRLYKTGKYELAELGTFGNYNDPEQFKLPWTFYSNVPNPANPDEVNQYNSNPINAFGAWKFEHTALDFKPDVVLSILDPWTIEFQQNSPFRQYYHWIIQPTIDSIPQNPQWISMMMDADAVFTYSDWGLSVLNETNGLIRTVATAPPGVDLKCFAPIQNKRKHKSAFGIPEESFVIGTVMRNQKRKLFPDLFKAFRMFLDQAPKYISQKTYLYLHASYPDWWELPQLMLNNAISSRCLFSYKCKTCEYAFASHFQDARGFCPRCSQNEAFVPSTHVGFDRSELANIYNLFDCYVQYANSEGFGMSQPEAAACSAPVFSVDYSAMSDVVRKLRGFPIKVLKLNRDADVNCDRAIPDNQDFVTQLIKFAQLPESMRNKKGFEARKAAEKHYDWDKTAKIWENYLDTIPLVDHKLTWESPQKFHEPVRDVPANMTPEEFITWGIVNVAGRPELLNHYMFFRLLRDIQWKSTTDHIGEFPFNEMSAVGIRAKRRNFSREDVLMELKKICDYKNLWEEKRCKKITAVS